MKLGKFKLFLAVFIILFLSTLFVYLYPFSIIREREYEVLSLQEISELREQAKREESTVCVREETIDYFYYKEVPESEKTNNKFGLYIYAEVSDYFKLAEKLVNSNGGEWGYVLIPYNVRDRDRKKWENVFEQLTKRQLIPVIQLYDVDPNKYEKDTKEAAKFLNSFLWPIKQRYISVYNEPNDSRFWKGILDPKNYAEVLDFTIDTFKDENEDFYMMNGAFNVSAASAGTSMDSFKFMTEMNAHIPGIFSKLDGWASHPYPQPNFAGNPLAEGRRSIRAYEDELNHLKSFGVRKELPVFITETGWAHAEGESYDSSFVTAEKAAENFKIAYEQVWLPDERVMAVMPFTIWYRAPFDHFSWVNKDNVPYIQYEVVKSMKKISGNPDKLTKADISLGCR